MRAAYIQQRLFPSLRIEHTAIVRRGGRDLPIHIRQSELDSACGAYCAAMALALLGRIADVTVLSDRRTGVAGRLWHVAKKYYFDGVSSKELAAMIDSLDTDLLVEYCNGSHRKCLAFVQDQLTARSLVIVSWLSKNGNEHHWVLAVGIEGLQDGRHFQPQTILCLDPGAAPPQLSAWNGRLKFVRDSSTSRSAYIPYTCVDGWTTQVTLTGAVTISQPR